MRKRELRGKSKEKEKAEAVVKNKKSGIPHVTQQRKTGNSHGAPILRVPIVRLEWSQRNARRKSTSSGSLLFWHIYIWLHGANSTLQDLKDMPKQKLASGTEGKTKSTIQDLPRPSFQKLA